MPVKRCKHCQEFIDKDRFGYWYATLPSNDDPWTCQSNPGLLHLPLEEDKT